MRNETYRYQFLTALVSLACLLAAGFAAVAAPSNAPTTEPEPKSESIENIQEEVEADVESRANEKRDQIIQEATDAITQTKTAIAALENGNAGEALEALERVTGKLEIILARQPHLALAPTDVAMTTYDLYASVETVKQAVKDAENHLEDGEVQAARSLLDGLASEVVVSVTNIPLATYPEAIKEVVPLIDQGKLEEARARLVAALNTLIVTNHAIPLPPIRAEALLEEAEALAEKDERSAEENEHLKTLLDDAHIQLKMAEVLGYHTETDFGELYDELEHIERKTEGGKSGEGFFDRINKSLSEMRRSLFG